VNWSLLSCGRSGHVTYAPAEPELREQLMARTAAGEAWRCLRCAGFIHGDPAATGPAAAAPRVRRGTEIRSAFILRVFAIERYLRALLFGAAAYGVWRFEGAQHSIQRAFNREYPVIRSLLRELGYDVDHSRMVGFIQHALTLSPASITLLTWGLATYAAIEVVEGTGLWLARRWGEYFAAVVTSLGLPYEIYDMTAKVTATRLVLFAINLALVLYLIITKRLFGVRGGRRAHEARHRSQSVLAEAEAAARSAASTAAVPGSDRDHVAAAARGLEQPPDHARIAGDDAGVALSRHAGDGSVGDVGGTRPSE
jgi:uncharacterized membrane protein (DUF2068 family)